MGTCLYGTLSLFALCFCTLFGFITRYYTTGAIADFIFHPEWYILLLLSSTPPPNLRSNPSPTQGGGLTLWNVYVVSVCWLCEGGGLPVRDWFRGSKWIISFFCYPLFCRFVWYCTAALLFWLLAFNAKAWKQALVATSDSYKDGLTCGIVGPGFGRTFRELSILHNGEKSPPFNDLEGRNLFQ